MKKTLFLVIFVLLLTTGCDGVYNLEVYDKRYKEDITIAETNTNNWYASNKNGVVFNDLLIEEYNRDNYYYKKKLISDTSTMGLNYKSDFDIKDYNSIAIPYRCYKYFSVIEEGTNIIVSTSNRNLCYDAYEWLDNITVNIKTNHKVLDHNADAIDGYTYTWYLTRENAVDKSIQITFSKINYVTNYDNEDVKYSLSFIVVIVGILVLIGLIVLILKIAQRRANKI